MPASASSPPPQTGHYPHAIDDAEASPELAAPPGAPIVEAVPADTVRTPGPMPAVADPADEAEASETDIIEEHALDADPAPAVPGAVAWDDVDVDLDPDELELVDPEDRAVLDTVVDALDLREATGPRPDRRRNETPILPEAFVASEPMPSPERGAEVARAIEAGATALRRASQPTPAGTVHVVPELNEESELEPVATHTRRAAPGVASAAPTRPVEVSPDAFHREVVPEASREHAAAHRLQPRRVAGYEQVDLQDEAPSERMPAAATASKLQLLTLPDMEVWLSAVDALDALESGADEDASLATHAPTLLGGATDEEGAPARHAPMASTRTATPPPVPAPRRPTRRQRITPAVSDAAVTSERMPLRADDTPVQARPAAREASPWLAAPMVLLTLPVWLAAASLLGWSAPAIAGTGVLAWTIVVTAGGAMLRAPSAAWTNRNGLLSLDRIQLVLSVAIVLSGCVGLAWASAGANAMALASVPLSVGVLVALYAGSAIGAHALVPEGTRRVRASARDLVVRPSIDGGEQLDLAGIVSLLAWLSVVGVGMLALTATPAADALPSISAGLVTLVAGVQCWYVATRASLG